MPNLPEGGKDNLPEGLQPFQIERLCLFDHLCTILPVGMAGEALRLQVIEETKRLDSYEGFLGLFFEGLSAGTDGSATAATAS